MKMLTLLNLEDKIILLSSIQFMNLSSIHVDYIKSKLNYENTFNIYI